MHDADRWGRNLECPGEDPRVSGAYATSFVRGFQVAPEDPHHLLASACCKHFVANSMETTTEPDGETEDRGSVNENISMQDLADSYLPPFNGERVRTAALHPCTACIAPAHLLAEARPEGGVADDALPVNDCVRAQTAFNRATYRGERSLITHAMLGHHPRTASDPFPDWQADVQLQRCEWRTELRQRLAAHNGGS